jgi:hypothetical protein
MSSYSLPGEGFKSAGDSITRTVAPGVKYTVQTPVPGTYVVPVLALSSLA